MNIHPIKTSVIYPSSINLIELIDTYITDVPENSVIAISSKIVSLCEGSVRDPEHTTKDTVIQQSAQLYLDRSVSKYNALLTITHHTLMLAAGVDESNSNGLYVLWPKNPLLSAQEVMAFIKHKFKRTNIGIIVVDSTSRPLRIGSIGTSLAHAGFLELNDYIGTDDLFGKTMAVSQANVAECLATTAVLAMGEGAEQTPIAVISGLRNITFDSSAAGTCYNQPASTISDDIYAPLIMNANWHNSTNA